jgi:hypothetical protein
VPRPVACNAGSYKIDTSCLGPGDELIGTLFGAARTRIVPAQRRDAQPMVAAMEPAPGLSASEDTTASN